MYNFQPTSQLEVKQGSLTDIEGAKLVARRLFETYDRDRNGMLDQTETVPMMVDAYKSFNRVFKPSRGDVDSYMRIMDRNGDGKVTYQDLEDLCIKYLCTQQQPVKGAPEKIRIQNNVKYSPEMEARIELIRKLFQRTDKNKNGYLDINEIDISTLISETFKQMGLQNYQPQYTDLQQWTREIDQNRNGLFTLVDFEQYIVRYLTTQGID